MSNFENSIKYAFGKQMEKNKPLTRETVSKLKGKPFFDEYKEGDVVFNFLDEVEQETEEGSIFDKKVVIKMHMIVDRTLNKLEKEYKLIRMTGENKEFPVYTKK